MISAVHLGFALLTLHPGRVGGSEANVRGLLGQFAAGHGPERVTVLANEKVEAAYRDLARGPVRLKRVRGYRPGERAPGRLAGMAAAALAPGRLAREIGAGIDVLHHPVTVPIPRLDVPTVTTVFDLQHHDLPGLFSRPERAHRRLAYDGAARAADLVLTASEHSRGRLIDRVGVTPDRVEAVPLGIDHERFTPWPSDADAGIRERLDLPARFVVYPANLWPHKNHERLVEGLAAARDREVELVLTGQDYGRAARLRRRAAALGVGERVHHLGYLARDDVPALLRAAEAMVFPSLYEGFGSPPLEAMACGTPVACARSGSLAEVVGDAALELDPAEPASIGAAIDAVCGDSGLRARLRERGPVRAAAFTWEAAAARHTAAYERVLTRRRA